MQASGISVYCAYSELVDITTLIPNPRNPNQHPKKQIEMLAKIIKGQGWRQPITVSNRSGFVVRGHGRLLAAQKMGVNEVPIDRQDYATEAEEWADLVADNRLAELSQIDTDVLAKILNDIPGADFDLELTGFDIKEVDKLLAQHNRKEVQEDDFDAEAEAAKIVEPVTKPGDVWILGRHRLMCGDSTKAEDVARLMAGAKADMTFTDPPYNINYGNIKHPKSKQREIKNDNMSAEDFRTFCHNFIIRIKENCMGTVYIAGPPGPDGRIMFCEADVLLHCSTTIIWNKDQFTLGRGKYQNKYEPIWFGWVQDGGTFTNDRKLVNVWDISRPKKSDLHPTMKPLELCARAINDNPTAKRVLDLFGGSGSTLLAAEQLERQCFMMELTPIYCDVIIKRWEQFTGQQARKEE